jgi:hypothetical protein
MSITVQKFISNSFVKTTLTHRNNQLSLFTPEPVFKNPIPEEKKDRRSLNQLLMGGNAKKSFSFS